tara:strand:- start:5854 stop:6108 length:255 start_codon:yes stop_codon:yes gene_type:complete
MSFDKDNLSEEQKNKIDIVIRQTDYDYEKSKSKLIEFNFDYEKVIKDFMGIIQKQETCSTSNQQRYKMIRQVMDDQIKKYENKT